MKYGWSPSASLGPQLGPAAERGSAATLSDWAERIDHAAAYGAGALYAPDSPGKVQEPCWLSEGSMFGLHAVAACTVLGAPNTHASSALLDCMHSFSHPLAYCTQLFTDACFGE